MNEIIVQKRTSVTTSRTVENPRSRENADAEPMPPMKAMGATYARNSPETGPPAHAGHMTASPSSGPGSVRPVRRPVATTWNARANTRPERRDSANAAAIEYGRNCMPNVVVGAQAIPGPEPTPLSMTTNTSCSEPEKPTTTMPLSSEYATVA